MAFFLWLRNCASEKPKGDTRGTEKRVEEWNKIVRNLILVLFLVCKRTNVRASREISVGALCFFNNIHARPKPQLEFVARAVYVGTRTANQLSI